MPSAVSRANRSARDLEPLLRRVLDTGETVMFALRAFDPQTGERVWTENRIGGVHWQSPVVANGFARRPGHAVSAVLSSAAGGCGSGPESHCSSPRT